MHARKILELGPCDAAVYPIAKTRLSLEFLRSVMHLRARTNTISAVARIRHALAFATHSFFHSKGFLYIHTPIITTNDCEGAGEMFQVFGGGGYKQQQRIAPFCSMFAPPGTVQAGHRLPFLVALVQLRGCHD